ncbi:MAG TPA: penicillin acylase family protein [Woeseiaceae bacterium]|nr:penicillin acylase family protein [Woeseiaceae bacterium]
MRRWFLRAGIAVVALVAAGALAAWLTLRASLPQLDGELQAPGLVHTATILRDDAGIPTITAHTRADLAYATGFAHGQDRFFQMDLIRRQAAGELSALFGALALETDKRYRFHRFRERARAVLAAAPAAHVGILDSYADGVNAGLASLGARPFEHIVLGTQPEPWQAEDSVLVVYAMFMQLNDGRASKDVRRGYAHRALPAEVFDWLYPQGSQWDAPIMGEARTPPPVPPAGVFSVRDVEDEPPAAGETGKVYLNGSNNWVVGGALTETGRALMSNDMHLGHDVPNIWYQARLVVTGEERRDVTGVSLPGTPFITAGSNRHIAWGYTNSYGDWADAVLLRPGTRPGTYRTPQGDREFDVRRETIEVKGGDPVVYEIRETVWGPVDDSLDYPDGDIAVSWTAHSPEALNLNLLTLETAGDVQEALGIAATMGIPPQNFVVGDTDGHIGWTIAGRIPAKNGFDAMVPADWSREEGWAGWLAPADYPRVYNPADGRIWTANARVADAEALEIIGDGGYDLGARARQIRDSLRDADEFSPADMLAIQYDDRALFLSGWRDVILGVLSDERVAASPQLAEYRELVRDWIPRATPESVGYRLVRAFRLEVQSRVFHGLMAPVRAANGGDIEPLQSNQFEGVLWQLLSERPPHLLPGVYDSWDELLLDAIETNIAWFEAHYDGGLGERRWGEINTAAIRHPLSRALPVLAPLLDMPAEPLNGDVDLPKAQGPAFGASQRFSVSPGDEEHGLMHMPTGQSGHPLSSFYRKGHDEWVHGRPSPFLPGEPRHQLTLVPAG